MTQKGGEVRVVERVDFFFLSFFFGVGWLFYLVFDRKQQWAAS